MALDFKNMGNYELEEHATTQNLKEAVSELKESEARERELADAFASMHLPCPKCGILPHVYRQYGVWRMMCGNKDCDFAAVGNGQTPQKAAEVWDSVVSPSHVLGHMPDAIVHDAVQDAANRYNRGGLECRKVLRAWLSPEEFRGWCKGDVVSYICRERYKGGDRDLEKARDFIDYALEASTAS